MHKHLHEVHSAFRSPYPQTVHWGTEKQFDMLAPTQRYTVCFPFLRFLVSLLSPSMHQYTAHLLHYDNPVQSVLSEGTHNHPSDSLASPPCSIYLSRNTKDDLLAQTLQNELTLLRSLEDIFPVRPDHR